jgi:hypothetical protein
MSLFSDSYIDLLILQYRNLPKAEQTINALIAKYEELYDVIRQFETAFDVDSVEGVQLDILGKIVGVNRIVPFSVPKNYFGFDDNSLSCGFADVFDDSLVVYPFKNVFESDYASSELNDNDYRFFIRAKIIKNIVKPYMIDDTNKLSLQDLIDFLFEGKGYIVDNQKMGLILYIDVSYDTSKLPFIQQLDLLPRPQAVEYKNIISYNEGNTFGFNDNINNKGFGDLFDVNVDGGIFANIII